MEGDCLANTAKKTNLTCNNFESWRTPGISDFLKRGVHMMFLRTSKEEACEWLCKYTTIIRKVDGWEYTLRSLYSMVCM